MVRIAAGHPARPSQVFLHVCRAFPCRPAHVVFSQTAASWLQLRTHRGLASAPADASVTTQAISVADRRRLIGRRMDHPRVQASRIRERWQASETMDLTILLVTALPLLVP
jgi:hypothetical protein